MTTQRALILVAIVAGLVSGALYYGGAQRVAVVAAAADIGAAKAIDHVELVMRDLPPDAVPDGAIREIALAAGRYAKGPIWRGQVLVESAVADEPAEFSSGVVVPSGMHAIAIPLSVADALGGAIAPGARVDLIAVPEKGRAPDDRTTELLVASVLVIDVRGELGGEVDRRQDKRQAAGSLRERVGSVVVAVGPAQELLVADRIASSRFVLALVPRR